MKGKVFGHNPVMDQLSIASTAAMTGIAADYCLQAVLIDDSAYVVFGLQNDVFTFIASLVTVFATLLMIILYLYNDKTLGKPSFCVAIGLLILWIVALFMYSFRKSQTRKPNHSS